MMRRWTGVSLRPSTSPKVQVGRLLDPISAQALTLTVSPRAKKTEFQAACCARVGP